MTASNVIIESGSYLPKQIVTDHDIEAMRTDYDSERAGGGSQDDIAWVVPHQASVNIIHDLATRLEIPTEMFVITFKHTRNLSRVSISMAHDEANRAQLFADGDCLVMPSVGAGTAWGAVTYRWYDYKADGNGQAGMLTHREQQ